MTPDDADQVGLRTARRLLSIGAIHVRPQEPFIWTSGRASPVYVDCRKVVSFPQVRRELIAAGETMLRARLSEPLDAVAGGETAGIPFAAWLSDRLDLPMLYIRKKPKGFGRNARIEGAPTAGQHVLLVEDLASDGGSKASFVTGLRDAELVVRHVFVLFHYDIYPQSLQTMRDLDVTLHALATFEHVLGALADAGEAEKLAALEAFMTDPAAWSKANGGA